MKKKVLLVLMMISVLALAGCSSAQENKEEEPEAAAAVSEEATAYEEAEEEAEEEPGEGELSLDVMKEYTLGEDIPWYAMNDIDVTLDDVISNPVKILFPEDKYVTYFAWDTKDDTIADVNGTKFKIRLKTFTANDSDTMEVENPTDSDRSHYVGKYFISYHRNASTLTMGVVNLDNMTQLIIVMEAQTYEEPFVTDYFETFENTLADCLE